MIIAEEKIRNLIREEMEKLIVERIESAWWGEAGLGSSRSSGIYSDYTSRSSRDTLDGSEPAPGEATQIVGAKARQAAEAAGIPQSDLSEFFSAVMRRIGVPVTDEKLKFFGAWAVTEITRTTNNPLATTHPGKGSPAWSGDPGMTNFNSAGVKNYSTFESGVKATVDTIENGYYPHVVDFLSDSLIDESGSAISSAIDALAHSGVRANLDRWGSHGDRVYSNMAAGKTSHDRTFISAPGSARIG
tara:strand:- start:9615 stop:10349 length:735 start_codon:yes stop_codon:yes gene_type:complete